MIGPWTGPLARGIVSQATLDSDGQALLGYAHAKGQRYLDTILPFEGDGRHVA